MAVLAQEPELLLEHLKLEEEVTNLSLADVGELMALIDRMVHEAYVAGVNREMRGVYHHAEEVETVGQVCSFADAWCQYKGTRP